MKCLTDIRLLYWRKILATLRNPVFIFMGITIPFLYLALFSPLLKAFASTRGFPTTNVLDIFVPGLLAIIAFSGGIFAGFGMIDEVRGGVIERLRVTPTSRFSLLAGPVFRDITTVFFQSLLFVLIAYFFGFRTSLPGILLLFLLLALLVTITSSLGNALGLLLKSEDKLAPIVHGINLPILLLSGFFSRLPLRRLG